MPQFQLIGHRCVEKGTLPTTTKAAGATGLQPEADVAGKLLRKDLGRHTEHNSSPSYHPGQDLCICSEMTVLDAGVQEGPET